MFYFQMIIIYFFIYIYTHILFFYICRVTVDAFYYILQHNGPENEASQFQYKFVLESGADEKTVCNVAISYSTDVKELYSTGKCVKLF
jgi:hypothetical protein